MSIGNFIGGIEGAKLVSGKIKPNFSKGAVLGIFIMFIAFFASIGMFVGGLVVLNLDYLIGGACGFLGFGYLLLISPYTQSSKNYYIEFKSENSIEGFKLFYKGKEVAISYKVDSQGKIAYSNDKNKKSCFSYADGSKMCSLTKYKIINYFTKWLWNNELMSSEITSTFE